MALTSLGATSIGNAASVATSSESSGDTLAQGRTLGTRYHIIRTIGEGGMGCVYQAWDAELGVVVALKVIRPEIASDPYAAAQLERRFKQELLLARKVTHKNVVRIHDLGSIDDLKYITMSFVDGVNLATLLNQEGKLAVPRALRIARGIAAGLAAAHHAGVVHRDLKPGNIMIDAQGEALIMDFGVASSSSAADTVATHGAASPVGALPVDSTATAAGLTRQTTAGTIVGTIEYMAPEQARGGAVDQRADIYAFGLILYDVLAGRPRAAHTGGPVAELTSRMAKPPAPLRSFDPTVPAALDAVVNRCLAPDAAERFQNTSDLVAALDRLDANGELLPVLRRVTTRQLTAASLVVLGLLGGTWWVARGPAPVVEPAPVSVLIADFENRVNDPVFDGSLEQAFSVALEGASFITAYPRRQASSIAAEIGLGNKLGEDAARVISRREGIKYILAGSVASEAPNYRISVRAIDPGDNRVAATATEKAASKAEVLSAVGRLAAEVREALGDTKPASEAVAAAETFTAGSLEALNAYVRAQNFAVANRIDDALKAYQEAIRLDPRFGRAYAGMGLIYANNFKDDDKAKEYYSQALRHVDRMTEREKYRTLGTYYLRVVRNYETAIKNYETLVELYPADDGGHGNLALANLLIGNVPKALAGVRRSLEIYPRNLLQRYNYAMYAMYAGDFKTAIEQGRSITKENPAFEHAYLPIALSHLAAGDVEAAKAEYDQLAARSSLGASMANLARADQELYFGRYSAALAVLAPGIRADTAEKSTGNLAQKLIAAAEAHVALGDRAKGANLALRAASLARQESILFPAARVLLRAGRTAEAEKIAKVLEGMLQRQTIAYARLIEGEAALQRGDTVQGIERLRDAVKRHDSWFGRFLLAKAYLETDHAAEALGEFEICLKRRGEVTDVFFYDMPTLRYLPEFYYYLGRTQEKMGVMAAARANYDRFLALRPSPSPQDPILNDARRRRASL